MPRKNASSVASSPPRSNRPARRPSVAPDDDLPEVTDDMLARAELRIGDKVIRRGRPPLGATAKSSVTLRLDADVLSAYRATGEGWQSRINADLRRARKLRKA
jgi:uncharacterized protein (DUF4415 family)